MHKDVLRVAVLAAAFLLIASAGYFRGAAADERASLVTTDGVIRFIIDGQEIARIAPDGLHVNGDVHYSGVMADANAYSSGDGTTKGDAP